MIFSSFLPLVLWCNSCFNNLTEMIMALSYFIPIVVVHDAIAVRFTSFLSLSLSLMHRPNPFSSPPHLVLARTRTHTPE